MKRNLIAAAILSFASIAAFAGNGNGNGNNNGGAVSGGVAGQAEIGGQITVGQVNAGLSASSQTSGNAVSSTKVFGPNAYSTQSTISTGAGTTTASVDVKPNSVTATTSQGAVSNVVSNSNQSSQLPTLDDKGLLINGTAGVAQVQNTAAAAATQTIVGVTGMAGIEGSAIGHVAGF
jgi:membrane-associated protease RseP (regulator of RpoE activity)